MTHTRRSPLGLAKAALMPLLLAALAACATPFKADVSRYSAAALPAPQGQSFAVVADNPALSGGIEFGQYAGLVGARMAALGYVPSADPATADLLVKFDYGVDKGREKVRSSGYADPFYSPWYGYPRYGFGGGYWGGRRGFYPHHARGMWGYGWYDPWFDGYGYESYTVYNSGISMKIDRRADGQRLFEGKSEAASTSNRLPYLVPNLVEAMFTGFPGNSGETVRISIAPEKKKKN
jgi:Domain of unknown function (DUF4136)